MSEDSVSWRFSPSSSPYISLAPSSIMFSVHWQEFDKDISRRMEHSQSLFLDILTRSKALHWLFIPRPMLRVIQIYSYKLSLVFNFVILNLAKKKKSVCEELTELSRSTTDFGATNLYMKGCENPSKRPSSSPRLLEQNVIGYFINSRNISDCSGEWQVQSQITNRLHVILL